MDDGRVVKCVNAGLEKLVFLPLQFGYGSKEVLRFIAFKQRSQCRASKNVTVVSLKMEGLSLKKQLRKGAGVCE